MGLLFLFTLITNLSLSYSIVPSISPREIVTSAPLSCSSGTNPCTGKSYPTCCSTNGTKEKMYSYVDIDFIKYCTVLKLFKYFNVQVSSSVLQVDPPVVRPQRLTAVVHIRFVVRILPQQIPTVCPVVRLVVVMAIIARKIQPALVPVAELKALRKCYAWSLNDHIRVGWSSMVMSDFK